MNFTLKLLFAENGSTTMNFSSSTSVTTSTLSTVTTSEEDSSTSISTTGPPKNPQKTLNGPPDKPLNRPPTDLKQTPTDPKQNPITGQTMNETIVHFPHAIEIDGSGVNPK